MGGYAEICNVDPQVKAMLLKSISAKLCPTVIGQACMDVIVNPPKPGEPSYESHKAQKETVLTGLAARAKLVAETFNSMEGITCNTVQGAMYRSPSCICPPRPSPRPRRTVRPLTSSTPSNSWRIPES